MLLDATCQCFRSTRLLLDSELLESVTLVLLTHENAPARIVVDRAIADELCKTNCQ